MFCKNPIKDLIKEAERKSAMRMKEIMKKKGIMIPDFPAENGKPRRGRIRKEINCTKYGTSKGFQVVKIYS